VEDDEYGVPLHELGPFPFKIPWNWTTSRIE
jgi:hypothetical protein